MITDRLLHALLFCVALSFIAAACSEPEPPVVTAVFALDAPEADVPGTTLRDGNGLYDLQGFPAFIQVELTAEDMSDLVQTWPENPDDYVPGQTVVDLLFDVPAGNSRTLDAVVFVYKNGIPHSFAPDEPDVMDLTVGTTNDVTMNLEPMVTGVVSGAADPGVAAVWLVDVATLVRLDVKVPIIGKYVFNEAPYGRVLSVAWLDSNDVMKGDLTLTFVLAEDAPTYTLDLK
jgi:hypothetical protein